MRTSSSEKGVALVTGGARRIGLRLVTRLAEAGYAIALHTSPRSRDQAEAAATTLRAMGSNVAVLVGDLGDIGFTQGVVAQAAGLGRLSLLVNNAAIFEADSADAIDLDLWDRHFAINLRAPAILAQCFALQVSADRIPAIGIPAPAGFDASIVNVIDQRVLRPTPQYFSYTLTKSALWTATRTMAQAFAERNIRVNAVGPGPVLPNAADGDAGFTKEAQGVPLHHAIEPDEIAAAVLYLAEARGVTGQMIAVDAGQHLGWRTPDVVE